MSDSGDTGVDNPSQTDEVRIYDQDAPPRHVGWKWAAYVSYVIAALSITYAVFFLIVTPSEQRGTDIQAFYTSYMDYPTGFRVASLCLFVSGLLSTVVFAALRDDVDERYQFRELAFVVGVIAALATAAHGLGDLLAIDKLAHQYVNGDLVERSAVEVVQALPSQVDPRGLATFGLAGLAIAAFAYELKTRNRTLGLLGIALGIDMVLLFLSSAFTVGPLILITGGLASLILGPAWWIALGKHFSEGQRTI